MILKEAALKTATKRFIFAIAKTGMTAVGELLNLLARWKLVRLTDPLWSDKEIDTAPAAYSVDGKTVQDFALKDHTHPEYIKKGDTVETAEKLHINDQDYKPSELAPKYHTHPEYIKWEELTVVSRKLGGIEADKFARAIHDHPEYIKKTDTVDVAFEISGYTAADFAPASHEHSEFVNKDEIVADAWELTDGTNSYVPSDFAPKDHTHSDYLTLEEANKLFLRKDEPYYAAEQLEVTIKNVKPTSTVIDTGTTNYAILEIPHIIDQAVSEVMVDTTADGQDTTATAEFYATEFFTCPGRWFEASIPVNKNILAIVLTPEVEPKYLSHFVAWSGSRFRVYQYDFPGAQSMKVKALIIVKAV